MKLRYGFNRFDMRGVAEFGASVKLGESLGYDVAFIPSSPLLAQDPYVMLANAASQTSTIHLGPMLENPVTRHPAVIAGSIATIARLSGGRAELALGVGDTAVRTLGLKPARVAELEHAAQTIRQLLSGQKVAFGPVESRLRHAESVPVWIAAGGPRTLRMAGGIADGVIIRVGTHPDNIASAIKQVHEGALEAGRKPEDVQIGTVFHTVMSDHPDHVSAIGRSIAAGYYEYAPYLFSNIDLSWNGTPVDRLKEQIWQDFHHTPDLVAAGKLVSFLPDAAIESFSLFGGGKEVAEQVRAIAARHPEISLIVPHPMTAPAAAGETPHGAFMEKFATEVIGS